MVLSYKSEPSASCEQYISSDLPSNPTSLHQHLIPRHSTHNQHHQFNSVTGFPTQQPSSSLFLIPPAVPHGICNPTNIPRRAQRSADDWICIPPIISAAHAPFPPDTIGRHTSQAPHQQSDQPLRLMLHEICMCSLRTVKQVFIFVFRGFGVRAVCVGVGHLGFAAESAGVHGMPGGYEGG